MSQATAISQSIQAYLVAHFPKTTIEEWHHENNESVNFRVLENNRTFVLRVMHECLEGLRTDEISPMLESYNVAQVMRDLGDFPIVVTNSGCIFGSP